MSVKVSDLGRGVFLVESSKHTSGLVCTCGGALVIDPGTRDDTGGTILDLLEQFGESVAYVVATRSGRGAAPGADLFPEALLLHPSPGEAPRDSGPSAAFTRDAFLCVGGVALELLRTGGAGDGVTVRLPGRKLLFAAEPRGENRPSWKLDSQVRRRRTRRLRRESVDLGLRGSELLRGLEGGRRPLLRLSK